MAGSDRQQRGQRGGPREAPRAPVTQPLPEAAERRRARMRGRERGGDAPWAVATNTPSQRHARIAVVAPPGRAAARPGARRALPIASPSSPPIFSGS